MLKSDDHTPEAITLAQLGVLRVSGVDAERFLQGQLSSDMAHLTGGYAQPAGYHNPQGRVIALLYLVRTAADVVYAVLPRELTAIVAQRLSRFVLRAKVKIEDLSAEWRVEGLIGAQASAAPAGAGWLARFGTDGLRSVRLLPLAECGEIRGDRAHLARARHRARRAAGLWRDLRGVRRANAQSRCARGDRF